MPSSSSPLPDVIGIGCRRCGSSMLHEAMNAHPQIEKPPRGLHYFSEHFDEDDAWYSSQFAQNDNCRVKVEYSVSYSYPEYHETAAQRIFQLLPHAKIFVTIRNPIERAYSDYLRSIRLCEMAPSTTFEGAIEQHPELLKRGRYHRLLKPYFKLFPHQRIRILVLEDLKADPNRFWDGLWQFLGVDQNVRPSPPKNLIGKRAVRWAGLNRLIFATKTACDVGMRQVGLSPKWERFKRLGNSSYRRLLSMNSVSSEMSSQTRQRLLDFYREDIRDLECMAKRVFDGWTYGEAL